MIRTASPAKVIVLVFAAIILLGACLLMLPLASRSGQSCGFLTALFTSCSATCVTGLSLVDAYSQWSAFGQIVLLLLIQVGGLGFMTVFSLFLLVIRAKLGLKKRMLLQQTYGLTDINGVVGLLRGVILGTAVIELSGAVVLCLRFLKDFPLKNAVWMGLFHSVSAFCNAGFDLMGRVSPGSSLAFYAEDPVVCITVMLLITLGGIGFFVWQDLWSNRKSLKGISVYTRFVLCVSAILVLGGALVFGAAEWNNPQTLGQYDVGGKVLGAAFQSVTTRTAGFASFSQGAMTELGKVLSCIWMLNKLRMMLHKVVEIEQLGHAPPLGAGVVILILEDNAIIGEVIPQLHIVRGPVESRIIALCIESIGVLASLGRGNRRRRYLGLSLVGINIALLNPIRPIVTLSVLSAPLI